MQDVLGYGGTIPIVKNLADVRGAKPEVFIVGKGLHSGDLPEGWKEHLLAAMRGGLHVINNIHYRLRDDPDFARAADESGITIWETKDPPLVPLNKARVLELDAYVIHTCGSDSNIGKKTTSLEIYEEANRRGIKTGFAATGQTGMMISGHGIAIDGVPGDFMGGAVEKVVMEAAAGNEWVVVEGQGSLNHIGASGVALAILHGALPHALVFCHRLGLERTKVWNTKILPIPELIRMNEELSVFERPAKVVAVSVNSAGFDDVEFEREIEKLRKQTGLPVFDPCRQGAGGLVDALRAHQERTHQERTRRAAGKGPVISAALKDAVLVLMHQGKSFTADVAEAARARGLALVALSSLPTKPETWEKTKELLDDGILTDAPQLAARDIEGVVEAFAARGYAIRAAIATFEGYRLLMADLNRALEARDCSREALARTLNKHTLRRFLYDRGLSAVRSILLKPGEEPELGSGTWFVKPTRGASSFAAFILKDASDLRDVPKLQEQMKTDRQMSAIFMDDFDFVVEEYVEGPEFSFEIIMLEGAHHLCVHEKARMEVRDRTTLETMSISPPIAIGPAEVIAGADFVARCLSELELTAGAFHVEAKYWVSKKRWEIIEVNPRMGGSLIGASTKAVTGGGSILELWVDSLLARGDDVNRIKSRLAQLSQVDLLRKGQASRATVFLTKYGEKGRTIASIRFAPETNKPAILKLHAEAGTTLDDSDRALYLMDALWQVEYADLREQVDALDRHATENFHVHYR